MTARLQPSADTCATAAQQIDTERAYDQATPVDLAVCQIVQAYYPVYLVVDAQYRITHLSDDSVRRYLGVKSDALGQNLFCAVKQSLRETVRRAVQQSFRKRQTVISRGLRARLNGQLRVMEIIAEYADTSDEPDAVCVVIFRETAATAPNTSGAESTRHVSRRSSIGQHTAIARDDALAPGEHLPDNRRAGGQATQITGRHSRSQNTPLQDAGGDLLHLLESTGVAVILLDELHRIKSFTASAGWLFELRDSDHGAPFAQIANGVHYAGFIDDVETAERRQTVVEREIHLDNGTVFIMRIQPRRMTTNRNDEIVILFFDITDCKRLEAQRAWLAAIVDSSHDAIISRDRTGTVTSWNAAAQRIFGYRADEAIGMSLSTLLGPAAGDQIAHQLDSEHSQEPNTTDVVHVDKSGHTRVVAMTVSPVVDCHGDTVATSIIARDISERAAQNTHRELLVRELAHRVKNTLASVQSIMQQTLTQTSSPELFREAFSKRIRALAQTHNLLSYSEWQDIDLHDLVALVLQPYADLSDPRWHIDGPTVYLAASQAIAYGMALHELATNAAKHGALSVAGGRVDIHWARVKTDAGSAVRLSWSEHNGPPAIPPSRRGFGLRLIEDGLAHELDAEVKIEFQPAGLRCAICVPLASLVNEAHGDPTY